VVLRTFINFLFAKENDRAKADKVGRDYKRHARKEKCIQNFGGESLQSKNHKD
jgi:hypothetical protein